jgi:Fe-S-cluster containining protein
MIFMRHGCAPAHEGLLRKQNHPKAHVHGQCAGWTRREGKSILTGMHPWMKQHRRFLQRTGDWFEAVRRQAGDRMQCGRGCALCCHGLFDISLPDALLLAEGLSNLPPEARADVTARADEIHTDILRNAPKLEPPFFLNGISEKEADSVVEAARSPRCPLLGSDNACRVYEHRPLACRLEGLPMVDTRDGPFGDWCELNFAGGLSERETTLLRQDYYELQNVEDIATEIVSDVLLGERHGQLTVFIPSVIVAFESFWKRFL